MSLVDAPDLHLHTNPDLDDFHIASEGNPALKSQRPQLAG